MNMPVVQGKPLDLPDWGIRTWLLNLVCYPAVALSSYPMSRMSGRSLAALFKYGSDRPIRGRRRKPVDVDAEIEKWHQALVGLFLAHTKEQMDRWDYRLDDLMTVILVAPVAQLRQFAKGLLEVMKADERAPLFLWSPLAGLGEHILGAPDEEVIRLKVELAERIARMAEKDIQPQLSQAVVDALKWRSPELLEKVDIALREGKPAR
ncbi:MAG: hypothetical protein Q8N61_00250, partial [bacterium]|nr:hypothetical protein [bacterium]